MILALFISLFGLQTSASPLTDSLDFKNYNIEKQAGPVSPASSIAVETSNLRFIFRSNDGEIVLACSHSRIRDLPDWEVACGKGTPIVKNYAVHFVVNRFGVPNEPLKSTYDFLYWVTDRQNPNKPIFSSISFTIEMEGKNPHLKLQLDQGVENDYASLVAYFDNEKTLQ